jgi:hypothetical protein
MVMIMSHLAHMCTPGAYPPVHGYLSVYHFQPKHHHQEPTHLYMAISVYIISNANTTTRSLPTCTWLSQLPRP